MIPSAHNLYLRLCIVLVRVLGRAGHLRTIKPVLVDAVVRVVVRHASSPGLDQHDVEGRRWFYWAWRRVAVDGIVSKEMLVCSDEPKHPFSSSFPIQSQPKKSSSSAE